MSPMANVGQAVFDVASKLVILCGLKVPRGMTYRNKKIYQSHIINYFYLFYGES